jgi:hypothetical protein
MWILMLVAISVLNKVATMAIPCSVKALGSEVECLIDFNRSQFVTSSLNSALSKTKQKSSGNLAMFLLTAWFKDLVVTEYK